ncbi:2-dehydro-3-deoxyphosphogluconate aldolase, partial [Pasteurellaceae bacterium LIM206]|nr:2-dehydro-3-deoxyphosphogluconate aldolase [Pasteurellaceae bacterium LIM206]
VVACGGSWFVEKKLINSRNWDEIGRLARESVALVRQ